MLLSQKYRLYKELVSESCTLCNAKSIIKTCPQMLSFAFCNTLPIDRVCMKKTSNPDIIPYLVQEGFNHTVKLRMVTIVEEVYFIYHH